MSYLTETATLEYDTSGTNHGTYDYHLPHTKTIDLIGEEFAPKRSQQQEQQQPSVIVENINPSEPGTINTSNLPITTMSQHLGPNVVFVNTSGGSGVPLQVQQIIQQAQQQVLKPNTPFFYNLSNFYVFFRAIVRQSPCHLFPSQP